MRQFPLLRGVSAALRRLALRLREFPQDRRGSVIIYTSIIIVPLVAAVGVSIDAARGYLIKSKLSQALDAAGLAGGRVALSDSRDADIRMYFNTNFPVGYMGTTIAADQPTIFMDEHAETLTLSAEAALPTTFMRVLGFETMTVKASNVIHRQVKGMELALVMDNTGSMSSNNRMTVMKAAASELVNILYGSRETAPNFWISLVPYAAIVNIGSTRTDWTFSPTYTPLNITAMVSKKATTSGVLAWRVLVTTATPHGFYNGQLVDISGVTGSTVYNGRFMVRTNETGAPTTAGSPWVTNPITSATTQFVYYIDTSIANFPSSGSFNTGGALGSNGPSPTITAARVVRPAHNYPSGSWKGCVEARDTPANEATNAEALPSTEQWRRSYWASTRDPSSGQHVRFYTVAGINLREGSNPRVTDNPWGTGASPAIAENWTNGNAAYGPNVGCGPAITSLQPYKSKALTAISQMQPWSRGGTMANLGLAWGWRVLSPEWRGKWGGDTPASYPLDYNSALVDKVVVLLTDGNNEWFDYWCRPPGNVTDGSTGGGCNGSNAPTGMNGSPLPNDADYTAYGRLGEGRVGTNNNSTANGILNTRMTELCTAMKTKNIIIYTIVVEVTSTATQNLYRGCATKPEFFFMAPDAQDLTVIFREIASQLTNLRLAR